MKLLLTSNNLTSLELQDAFRELTDGRKNLRVAVIPTAGDPIEWVSDPVNPKKASARLTKSPPYETNPEESTVYKQWKDRGHNPIIVSLRADSALIRDQLTSVDVIDVGGGDANWLLDWAKIAKLDTYLKVLLDRGVVYLGTSAGSCLLLPDIGLMWWEPDDPTDHVGLGVVDFIPIVHCKPEDKEKSLENITRRRDYMRTLISFPWKIYLLQDGQAIKVDGDTVEHIGPGEKVCI